MNPERGHGDGHYDILSIIKSSGVTVPRRTITFVGTSNDVVTFKISLNSYCEGAINVTR
jgi:hypothetical protein